MANDDAIRIVGFIGLGHMGRPMAERLAGEGYDLILHDADIARAQAAAEAIGAGVAGAAWEVGVAVDAVVTMLPDAAAVRAVLLDGEPSLAESLRRGGLFIDMSSSDPIETRRLGQDLEATGRGLIDAPVSGGVPRARDGTLAIMVGGADDAVARAMPLFEAMGERVFHLGPLGAGHAMKALNNYVSAAGLVAAIEAVRVGERFGLDPELVVEVLNAGTGRNNATEVKLAQHVLSGAYASGFALGHMSKDLAAARRVAEQVGLSTPFADACLELWCRAERLLGPDADHTAVAQLWDRPSAVEDPGPE